MPVRLLASLLALLLPAQGFAANLRAFVGRTTPQVVVVSPLLPVLPAALPASLAAVAPVAAPQPLPERLAVLGQAIEANGARLGAVSGEASAGLAGDQIRLLQEESLVISAGGATVAPPSVPELQRPQAVGRLIKGTMAFKLGMEAMTTAVPLVAMSSLHGTTAVALLVVAIYGTAQAVAGSWVGTLTKKFPASRVLAGAMLALGTLTATMLGLGSQHLLAPGALFVIYGAVGLAVGTAETARRLIPALLLGQDEEALRQYNARLHRLYEAAGIAGSALTGLAIWNVGPLLALAVTPPAALGAAWFFSRVEHPAAAPESSRAPQQEGALREVAAAVKLIVGDPRLRVVTAVMVLPQIVHRIFEDLILPVYAKGILHQEALSAALKTSSNMGELIGASFLLRWSARFAGPYRWVRWSAYGIVASWGLWLAPALGLQGVVAVALLVPMILVFTTTWAGSHLSLETELQQSVDPRHQPRVLGLVYGAYVVGAALASLLVGWFLDAAGLMAGLAGVCAAFTALGVAIHVAARRLRPTDLPGQRSPERVYYPTQSAG